MKINENVVEKVVYENCSSEFVATDGKPYIIAQANNGTVCEQVMTVNDVKKEFGDFELEELSSYNKIQEALNNGFKLQTIRVLNNGKGENRRFIPYSAVGEYHSYEYVVKNEHDKLELLTQLKDDAYDFSYQSNEGKYVSDMLIDWFYHENIQKYFKKAAKLVLKACPDLDPKKVTIRNSSENGYDAVMIELKDGRFMSVNQWYNGSHELLMFGDGNNKSLTCVKTKDDETFIKSIKNALNGVYGMNKDDLMDKYLPVFNKMFLEDGYDCDCPAIMTHDQVREEYSKDMYTKSERKSMKYKLERFQNNFFISKNYGEKCYAVEYSDIVNYYNENPDELDEVEGLREAMNL